MNTDSLKTFVRSRLFVGIIAGIGTLFIVLCIFQVGILVGYREAMYSSGFGKNYARNFGGTTMFGMPDGHEPTPHGDEGKILSIDGSTIVIDNDQQPEQKVLIDSGTIIRDGESTVSASTLTVGNYVVVVGSPDSQDEIDAKLIRILPAPPSDPENMHTMMSSSTNQ
jgi:hypothetical protein